MRVNEIAVEQVEMAWPGGDTPGKLAFSEKVSPYYKDFIQCALKDFTPFKAIKDISVDALCPTVGIIGRYRIACEDHFWFVRVSSRIGHPALEKEITDYLFSQGVPVNPILYFNTIEWKGRLYRLDVRPFLGGKHFNGSNQSIVQLTRAVRMAHNYLKIYEKSSRVKKNATKRFECLKKIREILTISLNQRSFEIFAENAEWAEENEGWLRGMVEKFEPNFHCLPEAQCLHGEIHPGNVIFMDDGVKLLDFEESVHMFAPPAWDLAFLVQRFCLSGKPGGSVLRERLRIVENEYGGCLSELTFMMRQAAWFSIAVILELRMYHNVLTPLSEYEKFVRLERQAELLEKVL